MTHDPEGREGPRWLNAVRATNERGNIEVTVHVLHPDVGLPALRQALDTFMQTFEAVELTEDEKMDWYGGRVVKYEELRQRLDAAAAEIGGPLDEIDVVGITHRGEHTLEVNYVEVHTWGKEWKQGVIAIGLNEDFDNRRMSVNAKADEEVAS